MHLPSFVSHLWALVVDFPNHQHPLYNKAKLRRTRSLGLLQFLSSRSPSRTRCDSSMMDVSCSVGGGGRVGEGQHAFLSPSTAASATASTSASSPVHSSITQRLKGAFSKGMRQSHSFHVQLPSSSSSFKKQHPMPSNDAHLALRYLRELIKTGRADQIAACSSAVFEAIAIQLSPQSPHLKDALLDLLQWVDNFCTYNGAQEAIKKKEDGYILIDTLERCLRGIPMSARVQSARSSSPSALRPVGKAPPLTERSFSIPQRVVVQDQSLDDIMSKLNLKQVAKFQPVFPDIEADSDDEEDGVTVRERKEERAEKHGEKTCEEEVEKLPDGSEIRRKKTRTVNMSQSSKQIVISSRGGGMPEQMKRFEDGTHSFDDDEDFEKTTSPSADFFNRFKMRQSPSTSAIFNKEVPRLTWDASGEPTQLTKKKTIEKTSEVLQSVEENKKKNGKVLCDISAQQKDTSELKATQVETYKGDRLLDRTGDGSYEEATVVRCGKRNEAIEGTPRKHVVEYVQTFGGKNNSAEEFFRGCTLASYIVLNDNLRLHEEQFRKKLAFEFSTTSSPEASKDFSKLNDLLQATNFENLKMPTKYAIMQDLQSCETTAHKPQHIEYPERPMLTGDIAILHCYDASEYLVRHPSDSSHRPDEVRGGPKDALLVFCGQNSTLLYQEAYISAYRSFMSADEVVQKLITRYLFMESNGEKDAIKQAHQTFSLLVRLVDELCFAELTDPVILNLTGFVYHMVRTDNIALARILRKRLLDRLERLSLHKNPAPPNQAPSESRKKVDGLHDFKSLQVARQMTMIDAALFEKIEPPELLWWAEEQNEKKCPNLAKFTEHFNKVSYWVRTLVITGRDQREREKIALKLIKVMKNLRKFGNLHSYLAILSALESGPIRRLDWSKNVTEQLAQHAAVMDSSFSFKKYRTLLTETPPPCIPYIGLVLQDLTFIHVGNQQFLTKEQVGERENIINYNKIWQQYAVLDSMRKFRLWSYSFERDERILKFLNNFENHLNEEETWTLSEKIKPRNWGKSP